VVLGSATPSFESYRNALEGKYLLLELNNRVDNFDLPVMRLVDMRMETQDDGKVGFFSKELVQAVYQRISAREQVILFLNRRGFARQMMCEHCGFVAECPECSVSYTYHRKNEHLSCHLCGGVINAYRACPECGAEDIRYSGVGTEKIESTARKLFPSARIERMDSDSMRTHGAYERVLNGFLKGDIDILIGTQMIAKGLHFPKVTLVGVINADQGLYVPDFRSEERTFQLLTQVAGRAGREELRGEVLIQTFNPYNETIQFALKHQFRGFYDYDMEVREELLYPPCAHLIAVHIRGEDISVIESFAAEFLAQLQPAITPEMKVVGPVPAPIEKIKNKYRYQIIFRGKKLTYFRRFLREMVLHSKLPRGIEMYVDVDALSLM
jgi:primosomal protein N' (replication factor Y)